MSTQTKKSPAGKAGLRGDSNNMRTKNSSKGQRTQVQMEANELQSALQKRVGNRSHVTLTPDTAQIRFAFDKPTNARTIGCCRAHDDPNGPTPFLLYLRGDGKVVVLCPACQGLSEMHWTGSEWVVDFLKADTRVGTLFRESRHIFRLVRGGKIARTDAVSELTDAALSAGLEMRTIQATLAMAEDLAGEA